MTTFLLIRHALTDMVGHRLAGRTPGVHLNREGRAQAEQLPLRLPEISAIYSSPLERATETAQAIAAARNLPLRLSRALTELDYGQWTGRTIDDLADDPVWQRFNAERGVTRIPGGETMLEVQTRMVTEMQRLRNEHPGATLAVVSHCDTIRAALAHFRGVPLDRFLQLEVEPVSVSTVNVT